MEKPLMRFQQTGCPSCRTVMHLMFCSCGEASYRIHPLVVVVVAGEIVLGKLFVDGDCLAHVQLLHHYHGHHWTLAGQ